MSEQNMKDQLEKKLAAKQAEQQAATVQPVARSSDPELDAAKERVKKGELAAAYRTRNGALVITNKSDPANSPAAPEAPNANGR